MKFYLLITCILFLSYGIILGQNSANEMPDFSKESLKEEQKVELYPNPVNEYLSIYLPNSQLKNVEFEIYNIIGNKLEVNVNEDKKYSYKINIKDFNPGYYLLIVKDPIKRYNKAFKFRKK